MRTMRTMRAMMVVMVLGVGLAACSSSSSEGKGGAGGASTGPGSSAGGASTGSGSQGDCHAFCQVFTTAGCPMPVSVSDCEASCAQVLALCPKDTAAANACGIASGKTQCDQDGYPVLVGCDGPLSALDACVQSSGSSGPGATSSSVTSGPSGSSSSGPTDCVPPNVGGCGFGVACCVYPGTGTNPASVPVCHEDNHKCCIPSGDGCSDDFQCCVNLACVLSDPNDPSSGKFCH